MLPLTFAALAGVGWFAIGAERGPIQGLGFVLLAYGVIGEATYLVVSLLTP